MMRLPEMDQLASRAPPATHTLDRELSVCRHSKLGPVQLDKEARSIRGERRCPRRDPNTIATAGGAERWQPCGHGASEDVQRLARILETRDRVARLESGLAKGGGLRERQAD
jgi:hypothetical protein